MEQNKIWLILMLVVLIGLALIFIGGTISKDILSGDGDFLPVLKYLKNQGKEIIILARGPRTAREIRQFAGSNFRDFTRLENRIKFIEKQKSKWDGHTKYPPHV